MSEAEKITEAHDSAQPGKPVIAIKGFNPDMTCRDFQFAEGQAYRHDGPVAACESGFHAIEGHPLEVFGYYAPGLSVYHEVVCSGSVARHDSDSKIACAEITIRARLDIPEIVKRTIQWVWDRCTIEPGGNATGTRGAASATGTQGAASATGTQGAASATGDQGAASATGTRGAASATGTRGAASATGTQGAASATGTQGRVSGAAGNALFLVERDEDGNIVAVWAGIAGRDGIKPDTWYTLRDGAPAEVEAA